MRIKRKSRITGKVHEMNLNINQEHLDRWNNGMPIQQAMPHLSADEREFLMTGITPEEWREHFGSDDE
jgi:hypothetical protein